MDSLYRNRTKRIYVGKLPIGDCTMISVQSMTNTKTHDVVATVNQINDLAKAGADVVRMAIPDMQACKAISSIKQQVEVPLIADIHFDYKLALGSMEQGIDALRLNPGNIEEPEHVKQVVKAAQIAKIPIRIGVNAGSLPKDIMLKYGHPTPEAMLEAAGRHIQILENLDFTNIKVSLKAHDVQLTIQAYRAMSKAYNYPLHLGITEAGTINTGIVKSAVGIGTLLAEGIGDTLRVSLTGDPVQEVKVGREILKSLDLRDYGATLISCPTCGRTNIDLEKLALQVEKRIADIDLPIKIAVMGCVVNGPGEAREADIGIAGGIGEGLIFKKGQVLRRVAENELVNELFKEINALIEERKKI